MNKGQRTIAALLTIGCVLLGLNLVVSASRPAGAQVEGPVQPIVPVGIAAVADTNDITLVRVFRLWSDGAVDAKVMDYMGTSGESCVLVGECGPVSVFPGSCAGDINHSGDVGFDDILNVIGTWGPCPDEGAAQ